MRHRRSGRLLWLVLIAVAGTPSVLRAAGINTNVALPVRKGGFVYRTQVRYLRASDDPAPLDRSIEAYTLPNVLVYGATRRTTLFGVLPYVSRSIEMTQSGSKQEEDTDGFGDVTLLLRQTVHARDAVQRTSRLALLGGFELPSGKKEFSSDSIDYLLGGVYTLQSGRHEFDADLVYKVNTEGRDVTLGNELQYNLAYELRVSPWRWPERGTPSQIYAVLEVNGSSQAKAVSDGVDMGDSGGTVVFLSPGVQWVTVRVIYEATVQIPLVENLNGDQVGTDVVASAGVRINY